MPVFSSAALFLLVRASSAAPCYPAYVAGGSYTAGAQVSAPKTSETTTPVDCVVGISDCPSSGKKTLTTTTVVTNNYVCVTNPNSAFCGQSAYAPGSPPSGQAWTEETTPCTVTGVALVPPDTTPKPWTGGSGCPKAFVSGTSYDANELVSVNTGHPMVYAMVYKCTTSPNNLFCGKIGYKPGDDQYWDQVWTPLGVCSGDMAPTSSPVYIALVDAGGCPGAYASSTRYEQGDRVSKMGLVYECKDWPLGAHCSQQGYEPGTSVSTGSQVTDYWKSAWTVIGHCKGSIAPTIAPQFNPVTSVGGCPNKWVAGETYEEADRVSVTVSTLPIRQLVYQCKVWPYSGFCPQFEPTVVGGDQGWTFVGSCDGTMGPTASPVFSAIAVSGGCPADWKASTTTYEANNRVSLAVSTFPLRKIVYECRVWPSTGYCNQGEGFKPGTVNGDMAWAMKGSCDGSMAPTSAPIAYKGDCFYDKVPEQTKTEVKVWDRLANYITGDVVRVGNKRFKCKEWPYFFWCRVSAYMPTLENDGIWAQAWTKDSVCLDETLTKQQVVQFVQSTNVTTTSNLKSTVTFPDLVFPTEEKAQALFVTALEKVLKDKIKASLTGSVSVNKITVSHINGDPVVTINRRLQQVEVLWEALMYMITTIIITTDPDGIVLSATANGQPAIGAAGGLAATILAQESAPAAVGAELLTSLAQAVEAVTTAPATEGGGNDFMETLQAQVATEASATSNSDVKAVLDTLAAAIAAIAGIVPVAKTNLEQAVTTTQATVASPVEKQIVSAVLAGFDLGSSQSPSSKQSDRPTGKPSSSPSNVRSGVPSASPSLRPSLTPTHGIWLQHGVDIDGEGVGDLSGYSVALSGDGTTLAVGADGNNGCTGHVRVFARNNTAVAWDQRGLDIDGEARYDFSGYSVALSNDGNTLAVGATGNEAGYVRVFAWVNATWTKRGDDINGEAEQDRSGHSIALSSDGNTLAVGATGNDGAGDMAGHVRVFAWNGTTNAWDRRGLDIDGEAGDDYSGASVALSSDGNTLAVGAFGNDGAGNMAGHVRVFAWVNATWTKHGDDIDGEGECDRSGSSIALSSDGNTLAVGAQGNDDVGNNCDYMYDPDGDVDYGHVRVFAWNGTANAWDQRGLDIDGEAALDKSGSSVALSSDGNTLAVGAWGNDGAGSKAGHVRVFAWVNATWTQRGDDIDGEASLDESGSSIALSNDGNTLVVGAPFNDEAGSMAGHVRVIVWT